MKNKPQSDNEIRMGLLMYGPWQLTHEEAVQYIEDNPKVATAHEAVAILSTRLHELGRAILNGLGLRR